MAPGDFRGHFLLWADAIGCERGTMAVQAGSHESQITNLKSSQIACDSREVTFKVLIRGPDSGGEFLHRVESKFLVEAHGALVA